MVKLLAQKTKQLIFWRPFLLNIVSNLNLPEYLISNAFYNKIRDPVLKAIVKYKDHPSIKAIERVSKSKDLFEFSNMQKKKIFQEIVDLDASNACQDTDVPTKTIKENADIFIDFVHHSNNASINNGDFPSFLKLPNVIPVFKKDCKNSKDNYRPISILKNISRVYERILLKQTGIFTDNIFSKFHSGFRKSSSCFKWKMEACSR